MLVEHWIAILAFILMALATVQGVHPPKDRQWKIMYLTAIGVVGLALLSLSLIAASSGAAEKRDAADAQRQFQKSLNQSQKEFRDFRAEITKAQQEAIQPGLPNERLGLVLDSIDKALGKPTTSRSLALSSVPPAVPVTTVNVDGVFTLQVGARPRLVDVLASGQYTGSSSILEWTFCNANESEQSVYQGGAKVDDKNYGLQLEPGSCSTEHATIQGDVIDANQIFFFVQKATKVSIKARAMKASS